MAGLCLSVLMQSAYTVLSDWGQPVFSCKITFFPIIVFIFRMLSFRGGSGLSSFRQKKLVAALKVSVPQVSHIYAEYWYFCSVACPLQENEVSILARLLKAAPEDISLGSASIQSSASTGSSRMRPTSSQGQLFLVVPRPGTINPGSCMDLSRPPA